VELLRPHLLDKLIDELAKGKALENILRYSIQMINRLFSYLKKMTKMHVLILDDLGFHP
jgi:hypothetical protein